MATTAKGSKCSYSSCGTYDINGIRSLCRYCIQEYMGPQLPSFAERLERFTALAAAESRGCSLCLSPSTSSSTVKAETEQEEERWRLRKSTGPLSDTSVAPHLRRPPPV